MLHLLRELDLLESGTQNHRWGGGVSLLTYMYPALSAPQPQRYHKVLHPAFDYYSKLCMLSHRQIHNYPTQLWTTFSRIYIIYIHEINNNKKKRQRREIEDFRRDSNFATCVRYLDRVFLYLVCTTCIRYIIARTRIFTRPLPLPRSSASAGRYFNQGVWMP